MKIQNILFTALLICIIAFSLLCPKIPALADSASSIFNKGLTSTAKETGHISGNGGSVISNDPATLISYVIKGALGLTGTFFLLLMIYGGYIWMMARGNEQEVEKAKKIIQDAIIGLAVIFAAYAITYSVGSVLKTFATKNT